MAPQNILVVRNDKLGDFMLSYPAFALLKRSLPEACIHALVPEYTAPMALLCPWIDEVVLDPGRDEDPRGFRLARLLRRHRFDALVTLFSTGRVAFAGWAARIPYRLAPATKAAQLLYNHRLTQRRSRSEKPEYAYNADLVRRALEDFGVVPAGLPEPPYLAFLAEETAELRRTFCAAHGLAPELRLLFVHPGSGGSAANLDAEQYARLLLALEGAPFAVVISAGPGEEAAARQLAGQLGGLPHAVAGPEGGLEGLARRLAFADLFVSGSTGPLHIAGALDRPTAAFYPRRRSATALRWQTLNREERRLAFSPPVGAEESDMGSIDLEATAGAISRAFLASGS